MKGNFAACTLSCLAWWDWFLSWSAAGFRPLVVIHVGFQPIPFFPSQVVSAVLTSNQPYLFIFALSRYQRSTTAISIGMFPSLVLAFFVLSFRKMELQNLLWPLFFLVAPVKYAHHAAKQMGQFVNFEDSSGSPSERKGSPAAPELPRLHKDVARSMFFCWAGDEFFCQHAYWFMVSTGDRKHVIWDIRNTYRKQLKIMFWTVFSR